jgi:Flp pilus assembly protein TadD
MSWKTALAALRAGRAEEAHLLASSACQADPRDAMAWHLAGLALLEIGDPRVAAGLLARAVDLAPGVATLRGPLGVALLESGEPEEARAALAAAGGDDPWLRLHHGIAAFATHDPEAAVEILAPLVRQTPADVRAWRYLGLSALELGQLPLAAAAWQQVSRLKPEDAEGPTMAGIVEGRRGKTKGSIFLFREAIRRDPGHQPAWSQLGARLVELGDLDGGEDAYEQAGDVVGLATLAERRRDLDSARAAIAPIIAAGSPSEAALDLWARLCRRQGEPALALGPLQQALRRTDAEQSVLQHALADTLDALGEADGAWAAWSAANAGRRLSFDPTEHARTTAAICEHWSTMPSARGPKSAAPIFIVGMPRSGTSLLEQMLDAHPDLFGVGEREEIPQLAAALGGPAPDPAAAAAAYLEAVGDGTGRSIDKMPHNFYHLGLIRQLFGAGLAYATDLRWLGAVYRDHQRLMTHWQRLGIPVHVVRYSALVRSPEPTLRGVFSALGVGWHSDCLRFHERDRDVATASFAQVQQPLYTHSIGRAAPYRRHLVPLRAALITPHSATRTSAER